MIHSKTLAVKMKRHKNKWEYLKIQLRKNISKRLRTGMSRREKADDVGERKLLGEKKGS